MKAKRWLTDEEVNSLDRECKQYGVLIPKHFKSSITPKMDDVIYAVPEFAKRFKTIGKLREEDIEQIHQVTNSTMRDLCSVRCRELRMTLGMQRAHLVRKTDKDFAKPKPRKFKNKH